jgi:two-component system sensor histidine kinase KdpD
MLFGTVVDQLLEASGDIDVYVIQGEAESAPLPRAIVAPAPFDWRPYLHTAGVIALCGLIGWLCQYLELAETNIVMVFLLGVAFVATRYGRGPAAFASVAGVLVFDFFFVPPYLTFAVSDAEYLITFAIMLAIGLLISTLTARVREQLRASQQQERHTAALYRLTKQLSEVVGTEFLIQSAGRQLGEIFTGEVVLYVREETGQLQLRFGESTSIVKTPVNAVVAQWVAEHEHVAGAGTDTLPNATALFVPLVGSQRTVGALGVRPQVPGLLLDPDQRQLLETCASLIALSIERDQSVLQAHQAQLQVQAEQLRSSLLSSVSHDLRTPLAAIAGAATSLLEQENTRLKPGLQQELLYTIVEESRRLARLVDNLLDMTRLESGAVAPNRQWHVLEEIIGSVRTRLHRELDRHPLRVQIEEGFPLLHVDGLLLEQVFVNLLENAGRYTPDGSPIEISAVCENQKAVIRVSDAGPGLPPGSEEQVFDKFFRGGAPTPDGRRGVGLGLAICQAIIKAHGGWISASNRPTGGAEFTITLPCDPAAPRVVLDETPESGVRSQESEVTLNS